MKFEMTTSKLKIHMLIACQVRCMPDGTTLKQKGEGERRGVRVYWNMKWYWVTDKQIKQSSKHRLEKVRVEWRRWRGRREINRVVNHKHGPCGLCGLCRQWRVASTLHASLEVYKGTARVLIATCVGCGGRGRGKEIADAWGALFTRRECGVCAEACAQWAHGGGSQWGHAS